MCVCVCVCACFWKKLLVIFSILYFFWENSIAKELFWLRALKEDKASDSHPCACDHWILFFQWIFSCSGCGSEVLLAQVFMQKRPGLGGVHHVLGAHPESHSSRRSWGYFFLNLTFNFLHGTILYRLCRTVYFPRTQRDILLDEIKKLQFIFYQFGQ